MRKETLPFGHSAPSQEDANKRKLALLLTQNSLSLAWHVICWSDPSDHMVAKARIFFCTLTVFFVLGSSLAYSCPDFFGASMASHGASMGQEASDHNPCGGMDRNGSASTCYRVMHDRLSFAYEGPQSPVSFSSLLAIITSLTLPDSFFAARSAAALFSSNSGPPLTSLYRVLRI